MYLSGFSKRVIYRETLPIQRSWPAGKEGSRFSWSSWLRHTMHLDARLQAERRRIEEEATLSGIDLEAFRGRYVTGNAVVKQVLARGSDLLVSGRLTITAADLLRAAALDRAISTEEDLGRENQRAHAALSLLVSLIMEVADAETQRIIYDRFRGLSSSV